MVTQEAGTALQKTATIVDARAISIMCDICDEPCEDHYGSIMITDESKTVTCRSCDTEYVVPVNAFRIVCKSKCRSVK